MRDDVAGYKVEVIAGKDKGKEGVVLANPIPKKIELLLKV